MKKVDRILKEWIVAMVVSFVLIYLIYQIVWPVRVEGHSMEKTLYDNAIVIVYKLDHFKPFSRGDIIVANIETPKGNEKVVKRIIGMAGDHVVINKGIVTINGKVLEEPYTSSATAGKVDIFVPRGGYFILGDNRIESKDSRTFGCIYEADIIGNVIYTLTNSI